MTDLNQIQHLLNNLNYRLEAKGYHARCDFRVGQSLSSDEPYTFKLEATLPQNIRHELGPTAAHEGERISFIDGDDTKLLYNRALDKIESWPSVQDQILHVIQSKLSQGAELAQAASISDYGQNEAWDALATYLRERAHKLAENGLPSPTRPPTHDESLDPVCGSKCPVCGSEDTAPTPGGSQICLDCDHVSAQ